MLNGRSMRSLRLRFNEWLHSATASMRLDSGLKFHYHHMHQRFFCRLSVSASAPPYLAASGLEIVYVLSSPKLTGGFYRLLGTLYLQSPYIIQEQDEPELNSRWTTSKGGIEAMDIYTECSLGLWGFILSFYPGSMGEHQISLFGLLCRRPTP